MEPKYFILVGGTGSGKDLFIDIAVEFLGYDKGKTINPISIIDFAKDIYSAYEQCFIGYDIRSVEIRKFLAGIKDTFDDIKIDGYIPCSCAILLDEIANTPDNDFTFITIREPKDAFIIKEKLGAEIIYISREVEHKNKIRCELIQDSEYEKIADYILYNNGTIEEFKDTAIYMFENMIS